MAQVAFTGTSKAKQVSSTSEIIKYLDYPESGVRFAGYYKQLDGARQILKKQFKAYYSEEYANGDMNPIETISRSNGVNTRFYITSMSIQFIFVGNYKNTVQIIDRTTVVGGVNDIERFKFVMWYGNAAQHKADLFFDFSDNPLEISGTRIGILAAFALTAAEFFKICFNGFEEII